MYWANIIFWYKIFIAYCILWVLNILCEVLLCNKNNENIHSQKKLTPTLTPYFQYYRVICLQTNYNNNKNRINIYLYFALKIIIFYTLFTILQVVVFQTKTKKILCLIFISTGCLFANKKKHFTVFPVIPE